MSIRSKLSIGIPSESETQETSASTKSMDYVKISKYPIKYNTKLLANAKNNLINTWILAWEYMTLKKWLIIRGFSIASRLYLNFKYKTKDFHQTGP